LAYEAAPVAIVSEFSGIEIEMELTEANQAS
jgi:hypothetical protein